MAGLYGKRRARISLLRDFLKGEYTIFVCRQCTKAPCIPACPVDARVRDEKTGAVLTDFETCTGCGECVDACPFDAVWLHPVTQKAISCDLCGGDPQCVIDCPADALIYKKIGGE
jgi:carbon-monoxide dehydrogenase iron sulfur subunit